MTERYCIRIKKERAAKRKVARPAQAGPIIAGRNSEIQE